MAADHIGATNRVENGLHAARIKELLETEFLGRSLEILANTSSTNDRAKEASLGHAAPGHAVVADAQSAGRGTQGRTWLSPPGLDLYLSVVLGAPAAGEPLGLITLAMGLAVAETVEGLIGHRSTIKWPNDVRLNDRKVAGILTETRTIGNTIKDVIVGVGLNINRRTFSPDLRATSMTLAAGRSLDRTVVLAALLGQMERRWLDFQRGRHQGMLSALEARLAMAREGITVDGEPGTLEGLYEDGALRWRDAHGTRRRSYHGTLESRDCLAAD